jgi:hypothetical protein
MGLAWHKAVVVRTLSSQAEELVQEEGSTVARCRGSRRHGAQLGRGQEVEVRMEAATAGMGSPVVGRTEQT